MKNTLLTVVRSQISLKKNASKTNKWDKLKPLLNYPLNSIQFCVFQLKQAETKRALETCCNDRSF